MDLVQVDCPRLSEPFNDLTCKSSGINITIPDWQHLSRRGWNAGKLLRPEPQVRQYFLSPVISAQ